VFKETAEPTVSANARAKGGRADARKHLASKQIALHGVSPVARADRQSRRASDERNKQKGIGGVGHLLIIGLPSLAMQGAPISPNKDAHHALHHAKHRH
jgi:hypothetical protein